MIPWFSEMVGSFWILWQDSTHPQSPSQWRSPESRSHHSSSSNMIFSRCLLLRGPLMSQQLSFQHDLPGQLQRHHSPDSKASKTKKTSERNLFANSYSSCLKHLQSSMVRASHSLRHSINASQTRHPSSPCFRNGWPFLGVYLIKCPTLCWKCLTWPAPTGRSLRTEKSFHFGKWQNITKTMPHSGKHHQNPAWFPKIPATCVFKEIWTKQKGHLKKTNLFAENLRNTPCL